MEAGASVGRGAVTHCPDRQVARALPRSRSTLGPEKGLPWGPSCARRCADSCQTTTENRTARLASPRKASAKGKRAALQDQSPGSRLVPPHQPCGFLQRRALSKGLSLGAKASTLPGLCWQLALTVPAQTREPAKGLDKHYPSPEGGDEEITV